MGALIFFFVVSIFFSFLCSILEAVILSVTPSFVSRMQVERPKIGAQLNRFKEDIDRPLSAILTLNTIAHTIGAIGVGVQAGKLFGANKINLYLFDITYESLIAGLMTLAILILSEIIPKTLGANYWKQLVGFTVKTLKLLMFILAPFVWISKWITMLIKKEENKSVLSRADVAAMANAGLKSGAIEKDESLIIQNLLQLGDLKIKHIMTPRSVIQTLDENNTLGEIYEGNNPFQFSRILVYKNSPENITGIILKDNILESIAADKHTRKAIDIKREVLFIQSNDSVAKLLDLLILKRQHLAVVADEFGTFVGLVTMEDVIETLFGREIVDETDRVIDLQKLAKEKWRQKVQKKLD